MATYTPSLCDSLHIPTGSEKHLFFVLCAPRRMYGRGNVEHIVLANASTVDPDAKHDPACELDAGCHPFISHKSYIAYRHLRFESVAHAAEMVDKGIWTRGAPCDAPLLSRMLAGVCTSKTVGNGVKVEFKCPGIIPRA